MKISPIKINNLSVKNQNGVNNHYFIKNRNFADTVSFKGSDRISILFDDHDKIVMARQALYLDEQEWKNAVYKKGKRELDFADYDWFCNGKDNLIDDIRSCLAITTLGLSEAPSITYHLFKNKPAAKDFVNQIDIIKTNILNAYADEKAAEIKKGTLKKQRETEELSAMSGTQEEKLYPELLNLIQREREGKKTEIPNCVMLSNPDEKINKQLIDWCGKNVNGQFITTDPNEEDLIDVLEEAEEDYQKTRDWNLIHVKDMDELIDPNCSNDEYIEAMKDIMTDCAEEFHSTLIFSALHPEDLDDIAIAPHRVKQIDTSNIKSALNANIEDAKNRLEDREYREKTPIAAINDILFLLGADKEMYLTVDVLPKDLETTGAFIKENSSKENNYTDLFDELSKNIWYCKDVEIKNKTPKIEREEVRTEDLKGLQKVLGMKELKAEIVDSVIKPLTDPKYKSYDIDSINGVLLYGPPGTGKSYFASALAEELGRHYVELVTANTTGKYMGETSENIAKKFKEAKDNAPSVMFIDEIESLATRRDGLDGGSGSVDANTTVTTLLTEINNAKKNGIFIVCASNEPQRIDSSVIRPGRVDKKIFVPHPDIETRKAFIIDKLRHITAEGVNVDVDTIAQNTEYYTIEDLKNLFRNASIRAINEDTPLNTEILLETIKEYKPGLNKNIVEYYKQKGEKIGI